MDASASKDTGPVAERGGGAGREHLSTERANPESASLESAATLEAVAIMNRADSEVAEAVARAGAAIARAVDLVAERLALGGRLFYVGAGTSGRLGWLDAVECPPTFQTAPQTVQAVLAGGEAALHGAVEGAEDDRQAARTALEGRELSSADVVFGISAGGTTAFVHAALDFAKERGAAGVFLACVDESEVPDTADVSIRVVTGPEVLAGSTRLKAGTAQKMVLNMISTLSMARLGKLHGNLMVDLDTRANRKLWQRGVQLVGAMSGRSPDQSEGLLRAAEGQVKLACVMARWECNLPQARERLARCGDRLGRALASD